MKRVDIGFEFLNSSDAGFIRTDEEGSSDRFSDGSGYFHGADGSEGQIYSDGSGYYRGADGSEGQIYSDGSGYYHGADGSHGTRYSDGSGDYNGADGSHGTTFSDGSGYYHGADGSEGHIYSDGSGYYHRADGSEWRRYSDGSGYYTTSDGERHSFENNTSIIDYSESTSSGWSALGTALVSAVENVTSSAITAAVVYNLIQEEEKQRKRRERREWRKAHRKGILWTILVVFLLVLAAFSYWTYTKLVPAELVFEESQTSRIDVVMQQLTALGYSNVTEIALQDVEPGDRKDGIIEKTVVLGWEKFPMGSKLPYDIPIKIYYHSVRVCYPPLSSSEAKGENYRVVLEKYKRAGFVNIEVEPLEDMVFGWLHKEGDVKGIYIGDKTVTKYMELTLDTQITIKYHSYSPKDGD